MSALIHFLDTLGRQPVQADFEAQVAALPVDAATRSALMGRDPQALARAFGDTRTLLCMIFSPEDEPKRQDDAPGDEPARTPDDAPDDTPRPA
jgi:hypothetical protein